MKYSLRSLMIVVALVPLLLWGAWLTAGLFCWGSKPNYPSEPILKEQFKQFDERWKGTKAHRGLI
jgi:hypothetical protein